MSDAGPLARALAYPFGVTNQSFTLKYGEATAFERAHTTGRCPVLAYGSNQSPARLNEKFERDEVIPVERAWLADHDVVYSAHIAGYGSIPAALRYVPGTRVSLAVTWLDDSQIATMHQSEFPRYGYYCLDAIALTLDDGAACSVAYSYLGACGHLAIDGASVALAAIEAHGRNLRAVDQRQALEAVRALLAPDEALAGFVAGVVGDGAKRRRHTNALSAMAASAVHAQPVTLIAQ